MKLKVIILIIIITISNFSVAHADPYPPPNPTPGPQPTVIPNSPVNEPKDGIPFVWGYFLGRWWMSIKGLNVQPDLPGIICVTNRSELYSTCYDVYFYKYYPETDTNLYSTVRIFYTSCDTWMVYYAVIETWYADFRQPNEYMIGCRHFPYFQIG